MTHDAGGQAGVDVDLRAFDPTDAAAQAPAIDKLRRSTKPATAAQDQSDELVADAGGHTSSDRLLGARFVELHGGNARYVPPWKSWFTWTGDRWQRDDTLTVQRMTHEVGETLWDEARAAKDSDLTKLANHAQTAPGLRSMLEIASAHLVVTPSQLDVDPMLLNTPSGTVDLDTGATREHCREDLITKMTNAPFYAQTKCPRWERFLEEVLVDEAGETDHQVIDYFQRYLGYMLTGLVTEQSFAILHGDGANGKSVLVKTITDLLGSYAHSVSADLLLSTNKNSQPELMSLFGKRLVVSQETNAGRQFNEALVKNVTGGDAIAGRGLYEKPWSFDPTHKMVLSTNHLPEISGTDEGIWRRVHLVTFRVKFEGDRMDLNLLESLKVEHAGILAWAVRGCLLWQERGRLDPPAAVLQATESYRAESDETRRFVRDTFNTGPVFADAYVSASEVYRVYQLWAGAEGIDVDRRQSPMALGKALGNLNYVRDNKRIDGVSTKVWLGIGIKEVGP